MDDDDASSPDRYSSYDDQSLTPEEAEALRVWWVDLRRAHGLPDRLSDPDTIADILRALSGGAAPRRKRHPKKDS
jgi:hypothetical protein